MRKSMNPNEAPLRSLSLHIEAIGQLSLPVGHVGFHAWVHLVE